MQLLAGALVLLILVRRRLEVHRPGPVSHVGTTTGDGSVAQRAHLTFQALDAPDRSKWWLDRVYANWDALSAERRRVTVRILLAAATYELLNRAAVDRVTVGPVAVRDLTLIQVVLPAIVAHQLMQSAVVRFWMVGYQLTTRAGLQAIHPAVMQHALHGVVTPYRVVLDEPMSPGSSSTRALSRLTFVLDGAQTVVLWAAPLAFLVYAYAQLYGRPGLSHGPVITTIIYWVSVIAALTFVIRGLVFNAALLLQLSSEASYGRPLRAAPPKVP